MDQNLNTDQDKELSTTSLSMAQTPTGLQGKVFYSGHVSLHSQQPPATLLSFGDNFHTRLSHWLRAELAANHVELPSDGSDLEFSPSDLVSSIPVTFQSC